MAAQKHAEHQDLERAPRMSISLKKNKHRHTYEQQAARSLSARITGIFSLSTSSSPSRCGVTAGVAARCHAGTGGQI